MSEEKPVKKKYYPVWVCRDCGYKASGGTKTIVSSYHMSHCDVCGEWKAVTSPGDFYFPDFKITKKAEPVAKSRAN